MGCPPVIALKILPLKMFGLESQIMLNNFTVSRSCLRISNPPIDSRVSIGRGLVIFLRRAVGSHEAPPAK